jgi:hypothetical protein
VYYINQIVSNGYLCVLIVGDDVNRGPRRIVRLRVGLEQQMPSKIAMPEVPSKRRNFSFIWLLTEGVT